MNLLLLLDNFFSAFVKLLNNSNSLPVLLLNLIDDSFNMLLLLIQKVNIEFKVCQRFFKSLLCSFKYINFSLSFPVHLGYLALYLFPHSHRFLLNFIFFEDFFLKIKDSSGSFVISFKPLFLHVFVQLWKLIIWKLLILGIFAGSFFHLLRIWRETT